MQGLLQQLQQKAGQPSLTIILNTHRTHPENQQDRIQLKNLQHEAGQLLQAQLTSREAKAIDQQLEDLASKLDHEKNLDSLLVFVQEDFSEFVRLPIPVQDRVILGDRFYVRDLYRNLQITQRFYVLVLSREEARLLKGEADELVEEHGNPFPIKNETLFATDKHKLSTSKGQDNLIEEFFNRVDKQFQEVWKQERAPLVVCTEERNYFHYEKVADRKNLIIGHLNQNRLDDKAEHIVTESWPIAKVYRRAENEERLVELKQAVQSGNAFSDFNEIWKLVQEGRGRLLFVQEDYLQPAQEGDDRFNLLPKDSPPSSDTDSDVIDRLIELTFRLGGEVIFADEEALKDFQGLGLVGR